MLTIHLSNLKFYSYHGVHVEERKVGGDYELNVSVQHSPVSNVISQLDQTVNYVSLYEIIKSRMGKPTLLLETIVMEIADDFLAQFSMIETVQISITKLHPPIIQFQGSVGVSFLKKRNP